MRQWLVYGRGHDDFSFVFAVEATSDEIRSLVDGMKSVCAAPYYSNVGHFKIEHMSGVALIPIDRLRQCLVSVTLVPKDESE